MAAMRETNTAYNRKWLIWCLIGLMAMCGAMKATGGAGFVLILPLILVGFGKNRPELLLYSILMTAVLTVTNSAVAPKDIVFSIAARSVFLLIGGALVLQTVGQRVPRALSPLLGLMPYLAYMAIVSSVGWQPLISYLKLILFTVIFFAFFSVSHQVMKRRTAEVACLRSVILSFAVFMLVGSTILIAFPAIGMMRVMDFYLQYGYVPEGSLFMGMTIHSQCLGPTVALFAVLLLADMLFSLRRWDKLYIILLLCAPILIYKTGSRTAMGTYIAGMGFVMLLFLRANARMLGARWKLSALSVLTILGIVAGITLFATPQMREAVARFALKYTNESSELDVSYESVVETRQGLMDSAMENFRESPWIGNGFQVSPQQAEMDIVSWKQLLSAPIEKGVWVTAVLEEGGIFGMILLCGFLLSVIPTMVGRHAYIGVSLIIVMLVANLGEFGMFSMSYTGGLEWATIFAGLVLDSFREREFVMRLTYPVR